MNNVLFDLWFEKENRISLANKRKYLHFDQRIKIQNNIAFFKSFFSQENEVAKHSFYPFIQSIISTPRYKKTEHLNHKGKPIRKLSVKERPISYCSHFDSFIYSWYSLQLTTLYEKVLKENGTYDNVLAYLEKDKSNIEFANEVFKFILTKEKCAAIALDITSFFNGLEHENLKKMWCKVIGQPKLPIDHYKIFKSLTQFTYVEKEKIEEEFPKLKIKQDISPKRLCTPLEFRNVIRAKGLIKKNDFKIKLKESSRYNYPCGIPQGSPISACLSNIYMLDFDKIVSEKIKSINGLYNRYCDDLIVIIPIEQVQEIKEFISDEIKKLHLEINEEKTEITFFHNTAQNQLRGYNADGRLSNLQYLGFEFNGQNIYIRSSSISRYYRRLCIRIRENLKAAYGKNSIGTKVFRKKLYNRYTEKGKRNFISYAKRAMKCMDSKSIYLQYKNNMEKVKLILNKKKTSFESKRKIERFMD